MSDTNTGAPAAPLPASADAQPAIPPASATDAPAAPSHRDWNAMAQTQRETLRVLGEVATLLKGSAPAPKPDVPAPPPRGTTAEALELAEIRERLALDEVLDDLGIPLTRERRNMLRRLRAAEKPADVGNWAAQTVEAMGWKTPPAQASSTPPAAAPPAPAQPFNPGAPAGSAGAAKVPLDPAQIPQSVVDSMTPEQALEWWQAVKRNAGAFEHPFRRAREAERTDGSASQAAKQIAAALNSLHK